MRARRDRPVVRPAVALLLAAGLTLAACADDTSATSATGVIDAPPAAPARPAPAAPARPAPDATAPAVPAPGDVPASGVDGEQLAEHYPELDWPFVDDLERLDAFHAAFDAAFDAGAEAGLTFLAEHAWPDGYTADAMLACRTSEPTPTYAELDALGWRYRSEFLPISPAPGFLYPPTGEYPAASGVRPYLGRLIMTTDLSAQPDTEPDVFDGIGRMGVLPDGRAVLFPTCFLFLPGEFLAHRVTDGHVGGYTDAEAEGDIRALFTNSPNASQDEVCTRHAADDVDALTFMLAPPDLERTEVDILASVVLDTVAELCAARVR